MERNQSTSKEKEIIRFLAYVGLVAFAFVAGWVAHGLQSHKNAEKTIVSVSKSLETPADITVNEEFGIVTIKGSKQDVANTIDQIEKGLKEGNQ